MFDRVGSQLFICKLKLYYSGNFNIVELSGSTPELSKRFYETIHQGNYNLQDPYFSSGSFNFSESSAETDSGIFYKQQATFRFPTGDAKRAQRIEQYRSVKYLGMVLTDGSELIMGRNDIYQNRAPEITIGSGIHLTEVKIQTESIQPVLRVNAGQPALVGYDYRYQFELS